MVSLKKIFKKKNVFYYSRFFSEWDISHSHDLWENIEESELVAALWTQTVRFIIFFGLNFNIFFSFLTKIDKNFSDDNEHWANLSGSHLSKTRNFDWENLENFCHFNSFRRTSYWWIKSDCWYWFIEKRNSNVPTSIWHHRWRSKSQFKLPR